jgi:hypothetical protein
VCEKLFRRHMTERRPPALLTVSVLLHLSSPPSCRRESRREPAAITPVRARAPRRDCCS